jgi:2-polyprenyl-3-methyl-5-hydroxy-6-metoxy-1,4-benzoquinol methylase
VSDNRNENDALGHILWDYFQHHKNSFGITERNDGFIELEDPQIWFSKYEKWLDVEKKAMEYVKGRRVLDIGCGVGRHALYLQKEKRLEVLGIDTSPLAIKICKLQGLKKAEVQSVTQFTLKERMTRKKSFDTILMLGNNFGLFENFTRARWLLRKFHKMTSDGASIITQSMDPYKKTHEHAHVLYHKLNRMKGRMPGQTRMRIRYKNYKGGWFDYLFVSKKEMESIVNGTGVWKIKRFLDSTYAPGVYIAIISSIGKGSRNDDDDGCGRITDR